MTDRGDCGHPAPPPQIDFCPRPFLPSGKGSHHRQPFRFIKEEEARLEEEKSNPMIALERRTQDSRYEMDRLEALEELRDLNVRQANVNYDDVIKMTVEKEIFELQAQEDADEAFIKYVLICFTDHLLK